MRVGQISKLSDADEPSRQNVLGKTAEELARRKGHLPLLVAMSVVLPAEGHALAIEGQQAMITDGDAMCNIVSYSARVPRARQSGFALIWPTLAML
jgi:hypothetical protein